MKYLALFLSAANIYFALRCFLNVFGMLQTTKYSLTTTGIFGGIYLAMGIAGFYYSIVKANQKMALLVAGGPWIIAIVFLLMNMVTGDYK